jgi:radical SAM superfamily enzyme YgiQ (UPF0313 family)
MKQKIALVHHPSVALKISGFADSPFPAFAASGIYLGNVYRRIMPPSLARVASVLERHLPVDVRIVDLRAGDIEETIKTVDWEGYAIDIRRIGAPPPALDAVIDESDWLGFSSHFTFESGRVRELIAHAKQRKPSIKVMVGGADVKARPAAYLAFGADYVCAGDFDPIAFANHRAPQIVGPYRHPFAELTTPAFDKLPHLERYTDSHDGPVPDGVRPPIGFPYLTRGCPRECDFCESRRTKFETLDLDAAVGMFDHYHRAGVTTLNFADDNLLLMAATKDGRVKILELFRLLREMKFAWEFPNGLEIGRFARGDGVDDELLTALLTHEVDPLTNRVVGGYRLYVPLESFDHRERYRKLKPFEEQNRVIRWLAQSGLEQINFGVVIPPDAEEATFRGIADGFTALQQIIRTSGGMEARYAAFHLIPIAEFRGMRTKYSVDEFPEGWNFYFPVYDGTQMTARELFERRIALVQQIDPANFESMKIGQYTYA